MAALASPALPMAAMTLPLTIFLPAFYATTIAINLAVVGIVFTLVRLADLVFDPLIGGFMDRTRSRWGRFKPWLAAGGPIVMAGAAMLFFAQPGVGPFYLAAALTIAYAGYSIVILSQLSIGAGLTPDYGGRSRVYAWWQVFNVAGLILVLVAPPLLAKVMAISPTTTVRIMGVSILVTTPITIAVALLVVRDDSVATGGHSGISLRVFLDLLRLKSARYLIASTLLTGLGLGISSSGFIFLYTILKDITAEETGLMLAGFFVIDICAAPAWAWIGNRIGKHRALALGGVGTAIYMAIIALMPPRDFGVLAIAMLLGGFNACAPDVLPRAMMADVGDEDRLRSGKNRTGMLFALLLITQKIGQALAIGIAYVLLDLIGFSAAAGKANGKPALLGVLLLGCVIPGIVHCLGGVVAYFYPLTAARHAEIRAQIEAQELGKETPLP
jgi:GPH family glycoside/pentoside/hexuronide:cation symporter